jgi:hypothetical protein
LTSIARVEVEWVIYLNSADLADVETMGAS